MQEQKNKKIAKNVDNKNGETMCSGYNQRVSLRQGDVQWMNIVSKI